MTVFRVLIRALVIGGVALSLAACAATLAMPKMDAAKALEGPHPIAYCGQTAGIYAQDFDLNPATKAAARVFGWFDLAAGGDPKLEEPVVVLLQDDAGQPAGVYVHEHGKAVKYADFAAVLARYPEPCNLPRRSVGA